MMRRHVDALTTCLAEIITVAVLWVGLFRLNELLFAYGEVSHYINWIFLPAGLRVLAALLLGWRGAAGLFIGALLTNPGPDQISAEGAVIVASLSAFGPLLAVKVTAAWMKIEPDLRGLTFPHLAGFAITGAITNTLVHNFYFFAVDQAHPWLSSILSMLIGDVIGTLIVLHFGALVLRRIAR